MTRPSPLRAAAEANFAVIRQGIHLLATLGKERYTRRIPSCFNAAIGGHLRHIVEHYQSFLCGLGSAEVDYEKRARDPMIENDPGYACDLLEAIGDRIRDLAPASGEVALRLQAETAPGEMAATSVLRELEFLLSHTIHHYALIAIMCRLQGCEPEASFGVAPSTLRFQQSQIACAR